MGDKAIAVGVVRKRWKSVSILLEALGRGLDCDLRDILRSYYWQENRDNIDSLQAETYSQDESTPSQQNLRMGLTHWRESQLDPARELLSRACCHEQDNVAARAALACVLLEQADLVSALEQLRVLNRLCPDQSPIQFAIGQCYERMEHPVSAAVHYRRAISLDETFNSARMRLAAVGLQAGNMDEAISQYECLCQAIPEDTWLRTSLGNMYFRAGRHDLAAESFQTVLAMEPENWSLDDENISQLIADSKFREAIQLTHEAIEQQGPFADLYVRLANLYSMVGDDTPAVKYFLETLDIQPNYLEAMVKLASHHLIFGRWEESAEMFGQAAMQSEKVLANYIALGVAQASGRQKDQASQSFDMAVSVEPNSTLLQAQMIRLHWKITVADEFLNNLGKIGSDSNKPMISEDKLQSELRCHAQHVEQMGNHADARFNYGVLLRSAGKFDKATQQFAHAVRFHRTHLPSLSKLGVSLHEQGKYKPAANIFLRILQPRDEQIKFHYRLGVHYAEAGMLEKMADEITTTQPVLQNQAEARVQLALSLETLGLRDRGAASWRRLTQTHHVEL